MLSMLVTDRLAVPVRDTDGDELRAKASISPLVLPFY